jgi:hypothetical protein
MIVGSVLLVIVAGALLGVGLVRLDATLLYSSIGVSALAALTLAIGVRRAATVRAGHGTIAVRPVVPAPRATLGPPAAGPATVRSVGRARVVAPLDWDRVDGDDRLDHDDRVITSVPVLVDGHDRVVLDGEDGAAAEVVGDQDLARVRQLDATVLVDRRSWFHRTGCESLADRTAEPMPAGRAVELGLTPCGRCRPVFTLLADIDTAAGGPGD